MHISIYTDVNTMRHLIVHCLYPSQTCSIFYTKRFCLKCAVDNLTGFPHEMQQVHSVMPPEHCG